MPTTRTWTDEELMSLPRDGFKRELVDGEVRVSPAGAPHGEVIMKLGARLTVHVERHALGHVFDSSTGVRLPSGNLRVPDLTFVSRDRMPEGVLPGFLHVVPDLVVEVLSPGDSEREILEKIGEYLAAGVRRAWIVDPQARRAAVHGGLTAVRSLDESDMLDGEDIVPGFRCLLQEIFAARRPSATG